MGNGDEKWAKAPLRQIAAHIVDEFHVRDKELVNRLCRASVALAAETSAQRPQFVALRNAVLTICDEFMAHMKDEELSLFPHICQLEECWEQDRDIGESALATISGGMQASTHAEDERYITDLRNLARYCTGGKNPTPLMREVGDLLEELATNLRDHVAFERDVLFARALSYAIDLRPRKSMQSASA